MADKPASDRTEQATPERLKKAREQGQVVQSQEVPSAAILGMMLITIVMVMPGFIDWCRHMLVEGLTASAGGISDGERTTQFLWDNTGKMMVQAMPVWIVAAAMSVFASVAVSGLVFSPKALSIDFSKVNPIKGMKNVISAKAIAKLGFSLVKLILIGLICYFYLTENLQEFVKLRWTSAWETMVAIGNLSVGLLVRVIISMLVIAAGDYLFQKWTHAKELRMTKQEVKEERKQYEAAPEIKGKIRSLQMQMSRKRMLADVPQADVVITNPTHFAVALKYDPETMPVPMVLAKGPDALAQKIKQVAREHNVPVIERPPLARALFAAAEVGHPIPSELFVAVAEVLAMILRMRQKRKAAGFDLTTKPKKLNSKRKR